MIPSHLARFSDPTPVLGAGFCRLVDCMGDDGAVVTAARVTTGKGRSAHEEGAGLDALGRRCCKVCRRPMERLETVGLGLSPDIRDMRHAANVLYEHEGGDVCLEGDRRLIRFMLRNAHWSPFEFAEAVFHLRVPMDVMRQLVRHWSLSFQEYSTRYSPAVDVMLTTPPAAWRLQSEKNRQGSSGFVKGWPEGWEIDVAGDVRDFSPGAGGQLRWEARDDEERLPGAFLSHREAELHAHAKRVYEERLAFGVAKEQARKDLPLSNMTDVFVKGNLRDILNMLGQRIDSHAQHEIQQYANAIAEIVKLWCPLSWEAFVDYRIESRTFSKQEMEILREMIQDWKGNAEYVAQRDHDHDAALVADWPQRSLNENPKAAQLSAREKAAFLKALGISDG